MTILAGYGAIFFYLKKIILAPTYILPGFKTVFLMLNLYSINLSTLLTWTKITRSVLMAEAGQLMIDRFELLSERSAVRGERGGAERAWRPDQQRLSGSALENKDYWSTYPCACLVSMDKSSTTSKSSLCHESPSAIIKKWWRQVWSTCQKWKHRAGLCGLEAHRSHTWGPEPRVHGLTFGKLAAI